MKYRKKPVVIEAFLVADILGCAYSQWDKMPLRILKAYDDEGLLFLPDSVEINTLEGRMTAQRGDWIIQGVKGELYPCRSDIFEATYERVEGQ